MKPRNTCVVTVCMFLLLIVPMVLGQTAGTGALRGTVTDQSGAVVPNATITATNLDTGQARTATTGADGTYTFSLLPPGNTRAATTASAMDTATRPTVFAGGPAQNSRHR